MKTKNSELKTLKDLKEDLAGGYMADNTRDFAEELKAEAVKWVKEFNTGGYSIKKTNNIEWIKHFFNLTSQEIENA